MDVRAPVIAGLYVPGDRPERFAKAVAAGADQVIIDLEDAVARERKAFARRAVADFLRTHVPDPAGAGRIAVRPNGLGTPWHRDDLAMLSGSPDPPALRLPKVEGADDIERVLTGFPVAGRPEITALIESALGVERAFAIAGHPAVTAVALGEADLRAQLGITADTGLDWLRVRLVVAARAAGLDPPNMAVFPGLDDLPGLAESCRGGAALGMLGRTAVHPRQLPVIRAAFAPSEREITRAEEVLAALAGGAGAARLADGAMVDEAMAAQARRTLKIRDLTRSAG